MQASKFIPIINIKLCGIFRSRKSSDINRKVTEEYADKTQNP